MAKLTIKSAPPAVAPPVPEAKRGAGWAYYVVPPLLIAAVFYYCSSHAHKVPAPARPAAAAAPAQDKTAVEPVQPQPAAEPAEEESDFETDTEEPIETQAEGQEQ